MADSKKYDMVLSKNGMAWGFASGKGATVKASIGSAYKMWKAGAAAPKTDMTKEFEAYEKTLKKK